MNISKTLSPLVASLFLVGTLIFLSSATESEDKKIKLVYAIPAGCELDSLRLFTFSGVAFKVFSSTAKMDNTFEFELDMQSPNFFFVGPSVSALKSVILGDEKLVTMDAQCGKYKNAQIGKSKVNHEYQTFLKERNQLNRQSTNIIKAYRMTKAEDVATRDSLNKVLAFIDKSRIELPNQFKSEIIQKTAQLFTYQSFQNHGGKDEIEIDYFAKNYFANVDFSDPIYNQISVVYEVFKNYTTTLNRAKLSSKVHAGYLENAVAKIDENTMAYKYALGGIVNTLFSADHRNMPRFASMYVKKYYADDKEELGQMKLVVDQINANTIGAEAPDIILNSPEDKEIALSTLKGKVVLIDFWASWCGPCRRENPNVVRMYDKYKDQGFEIYGVSLDSKKDRWIGAIEADGLTWPHVSDLRGWQSYAAKMYSVRSIPTTILIDKEGKILARNLRGATLEAKLEELFN